MGPGTWPMRGTPRLVPRDVGLGVLWRIDPARGGGAGAARILGLIVDGLRAGARPAG